MKISPAAAFSSAEDEGDRVSVVESDREGVLANLRCDWKGDETY